MTVWDWSKKVVLFKDGVRWTLNSCSFSPDGRLLVAAGEGGELKVYKVTPQGDPVRVERGEGSELYPGATDALVFSPDGKRLFAPGSDQIRVWEVPGWRKGPILKGRCLALSRDGKTMAIGDYRRGIVEFGPVSKIAR